MPVLPGGRVPVQVGSDDFDRADSTSIGVAWVEEVGDWDIFTNTLREVTGGNAVARWVGVVVLPDHGAEDVIASTGGVPSAATNTGPACRVQPGGDMYFYRFDSSDFRTRLLKFVGGAFTVLAGPGATMVGDGLSTKMEMYAYGSRLVTYYEGALDFDVADSSLTGGQPGVGMVRLNGRVDNFKAYNVPGAASPTVVPQIRVLVPRRRPRPRPGIVESVSVYGALSRRRSP